MNDWVPFMAWAVMFAYGLWQAYVIRKQRALIDEITRLERARMEGPPLVGFTDLCKALSDIARSRMVETDEDVPVGRL